MNNQQDIVIVSAVRTAIGAFGGSLKDYPGADLATIVVKDAFRRANLDPESAQQIVLGNVIQCEPRDLYVARVAGVSAGMMKQSAALTLNRLCGSGLQAIITAANTIQLGDAEIAVGGGVETMSRAPYLAQNSRWGTRIGDAKLLDMLLGALNDPFGAGHMGITAENMADHYGISRKDQDMLAAESQRKATAAIEAGHFKSQIVSVDITQRGQVINFDTDEHPKPGTSVETLAKLKPAFRPENGTVTAGNASGLNDGAAACVLMNAKVASRANVSPLARLISYAVVGVEPSMMGTGPIPAVQLALRRAGLSLDQIDVIESNEAFAAQALGVCRGLELDPVKINPNGGAIALGHPLGATGTIITVKCIHELIRTQKRYGLVTMCIGGGQGIAAVFERL